jgi:hypothetical protein
MKMKKCLLILAITLAFLCAGTQAIALLETTTLSSIMLNIETAKIMDCGLVSPNGGGGDPVDGPGWPT